MGHIPKVVCLNGAGIGQYCDVKRIPRKGETAIPTNLRYAKDSGKGVNNAIVIGRLGGAVKTVPKAVTASSLCSMAAAGMTGSNYPAYVLTVSAFSEVYDSLGLERSVLSRSCEMAAFCGAVLPWTSTGAFMSSVLGVPAFAYAPYFFFGLLVPILTIVCSCSGWGIFYIEQGQKEEDRG